MTSNKRGMVDGTRDVRAAEEPVWVFDPQSVALDNRPITQVHTWLTRPADDEALDILKAHDFTQTSNAVGGSHPRVREDERSSTRRRLWPRSAR